MLSGYNVSQFCSLVCVSFGRHCNQQQYKHSNKVDINSDAAHVRAMLSARIIVRSAGKEIKCPGYFILRLERELKIRCPTSCRTILPLVRILSTRKHKICWMIFRLIFQPDDGMHLGHNT